MIPHQNEFVSVLSLDGEWECSLAGQTGRLNVPGTWEAQGFPRRVDGPAELRKTVVVPADWEGKQVELQFDAVSYHADINVNHRQYYLRQTGMWTPFTYDVSYAIHPGEENTIMLTVWKPGGKFPMRESLAGFLPDIWMPFGGIWQSARLVAFGSPTLSSPRINIDNYLGNSVVTISGGIHRARPGTVVIEVFDPAGNSAGVWRTLVAGSAFNGQVTINNPQRWSPSSPNLYTAEIRLEDKNGAVTSRVRQTIGFRSLTHDGGKLLLNDQPAFLRGILNWGWYPDILCPAPDEATIRDEFRRVRAFGYNMVKLCLCVPSELYFEIADEEGMLLWLELPMWLPQVTEHLRQQAVREYTDILARVRHHPSIVIYSLGCELSRMVDSDLLSQLNRLLRANVSDVMVCDNSGSGEAYGGLSFDYSDFNDYHFYSELHFFDPLVDHFRRDWRPPRPWIFGEFCDADDYRDVTEIAAAYGGELPIWLTEQNPLHPTSFIAFHEQTARMKALDIPFDHQTLQRISRQQSFVVRKTILEKVRTRADMGGYVVTGLRDTPIATSSMFDDLNRPKYDADSFREFNGENVLLLEQGRRRTWRNGGDRPAPIDRFNRVSGEMLDYRIVLSGVGAALPEGGLRWKLLTPEGQTVDEGHIAVKAVSPNGVPVEIARLAFTAPTVETPQEFTLVVEWYEWENQLRNHWPLWVYPAVTTWPNDLVAYDPAGSLAALDDLYAAAENITSRGTFHVLGGKTLITNVFTPEVRDFVQSSGRAIILQAGLGGLPMQPCPFWREGIKLLYEHPILKTFPHRGYADLQFYHLATDYAFDPAQIKALLPDATIMPIIRRLDARQFTLSDYLVELQIGAGRVMASTLHFAGGAGDQVNSLRANIAGRWLLNEMMAYLQTAS